MSGLLELDFLLDLRLLVVQTGTHDSSPASWQSRPIRSLTVEAAPTGGASGPRDLSTLIMALGTYRAAREKFLVALGCESSNRDPFAEFAEHVALAVVGGEMAQSRVQKGWDFTDGEGRRVQVRYLSNPAGPWVNEHLVDFRGDGCDRYALVLFEALDLVAMIVFDREGLERVCAALKKRHPRQDLTLQFTSANYRDRRRA